MGQRKVWALSSLKRKRTNINERLMAQERRTERVWGFRRKQQRDEQAKNEKAQSQYVYKKRSLNGWTEKEGA